MMKNYPIYSAGLAMLLAWHGSLLMACSETKPEADAWHGDAIDTADVFGIDPTNLDADQIVLAFKVGGGMMWEPEQILETIHHGGAIYVYGDGTVWDQTGPWGSETGFRQWKTGKLPLEVWADVLATAERVQNDDAGYYEVCVAMDAGTEFLAVDLPGLSLLASAFYAFKPSDGECEPQIPNDALPRQELVDLVEAVRKLGQYATEPVVTDAIVLGWYSVEWPPMQGICEQAKTVDWPFADVPLEPSDQRELLAMRLSGQQANDVRTFIEQQWHLLEQPGTSRVCVKFQESAFAVFYDDALPDDHTYPFFDGDLSEMSL